MIELELTLSLAPEHILLSICCFGEQAWLLGQSRGCPHAFLSPHPQDSGGWTPIIWAAEHKHIEVIRMLLTRGADVTLTDNVRVVWDRRDEDGPRPLNKVEAGFKGSLPVPIHSPPTSTGGEHLPTLGLLHWQRRHCRGPPECPL